MLESGSTRTSACVQWTDLFKQTNKHLPPTLQQTDPTKTNPQNTNKHYDLCLGYYKIRNDFWIIKPHTSSNQSTTFNDLSRIPTNITTQWRRQHLTLRGSKRGERWKSRKAPRKMCALWAEVGLNSPLPFLGSATAHTPAVSYCYYIAIFLINILLPTILGSLPCHRNMCHQYWGESWSELLSSWYNMLFCFLVLTFVQVDELMSSIWQRIAVH